MTFPPPPAPLQRLLAQALLVLPARWLLRTTYPTEAAIVRISARPPRLEAQRQTNLALGAAAGTLTASWQLPPRPGLRAGPCP
eukprot:366242-Chlamydomonas_euryale.AAC.15